MRGSDGRHVHAKLGDLMGDGDPERIDSSLACRGGGGNVNAVDHREGILTKGRGFVSLWIEDYH